mgnify:CR=1 FL=1
MFPNKDREDLSPTEYMMRYCRSRQYNFQLLLNDPMFSTDPTSETYTAEKELPTIKVSKLMSEIGWRFEKLKSILGKLNNKAFIEKAPDNVIENFRIQEQDMKSSIEKINEIINTIN